MAWSAVYRKLTDGRDLSCGLDASLGHVSTTRLVNLLLVVPLLPNVGSGSKTDPKAKTEKTDPYSDGAKSMSLPKNQREGGVEEKAQPVQVTIEQCRKYDDSLCTQESERPEEGDPKEFLSTSLLQMRRHANTLATASTVDALPYRSPCENDAMSSLTTVGK